ncbi:MAG: hypothetical protein Kow0069_18850 [Promethearchaeota archaeon]
MLPSPCGGDGGAGKGRGERELLACFNLEDLPKFQTGKITPLIFPVERRTAHQRGVPHLITRVFGIGTDGRYLVQKRAHDRESNPDRYTDSASGHVTYEPRLTFEAIHRNALRELDEEVGTRALKVRFWRTHYSEQERELEYCFLAVVAPPCSTSSPEVAAGTGFYSKGELLQLLSTRGDEFVEQVAQFWREILDYGLLEDLLSEGEVEGELGDDAPEGDDEPSGNAVFLGRFQPLHLGHLKVVLWILERHERVTFAVGSSQASRTPENPFSFEERAWMVRASMEGAGVPPERFEIVPVEDAFDAERWCDELVAKFTDSEVTFYTNNEWIRELLGARGARLGPVRRFEIEKLNGTRVRERVLGGLPVNELVPPEVARFLRSQGRKILEEASRERA